MVNLRNILFNQMEYEWASDQPYPSLNDVYNWPEITRILRTHEWFHLTSNSDLAASVYVYHGLVRKWSQFLKENEEILDKLTNSNKNGGKGKESCEAQTQIKSVPIPKPIVEADKDDQRSSEIIDVCCSSSTNKLCCTNVSKECSTTTIKDKSEVNYNIIIKDIFTLPLEVADEKSETIEAEKPDKTQSARVSIIYSTNLNSLITNPASRLGPVPDILQKRKSHCLKPFTPPVNEKLTTNIKVGFVMNNSQKENDILITKEPTTSSIHQNDCSRTMSEIVPPVLNSKPVDKQLNNSNRDDSINHCKSIHNYNVPYSLPCLLDDLDTDTVNNKRQNSDKLINKLINKKLEKIDERTHCAVQSVSIQPSDNHITTKQVVVLTEKNSASNEKNTDPEHKLRRKSSQKKKRFKYYKKKYGLKKCVVRLERSEVIEKYVRTYKCNGHFIVKTTNNNKLMITLSRQYNVNTGEQNKINISDNYVMCTSNRVIERRLNIDTHFTHLRMDDCFSKELKKIERSSNSIFNQECGFFNKIKTQGTFLNNGHPKYSSTSIIPVQFINSPQSKKKNKEKYVKSKENNKSRFHFGEIGKNNVLSPQKKHYKINGHRGVPSVSRVITDKTLSIYSKSSVFNPLKKFESTVVKSELNSVKGGVTHLLQQQDQIKCGYFSFSLLKNLKTCDVSPERNSAHSKAYELLKKDKKEEKNYKQRTFIGKVKPPKIKNSNAEISTSTCKEVNIHSKEADENKVKLKVAHNSDSNISKSASGLVDNNVNIHVPVIRQTNNVFPQSNNIMDVNERSNNNTLKTLKAKENRMVSTKPQNTSKNVKRVDEDPRTKNSHYNKRYCSSTQSDSEPIAKRICIRSDLPRTAAELKSVSFDHFTCSSCLLEFNDVKQWILHSDGHPCRPVCAKTSD